MSGNLKVTVSGEEIEFSSLLVGGKLNDYEETPTSMFVGALNLDELHNALFYVNRTVLKILMNQLNISVDEAELFLFSALSESVVKELNVLATGEKDMDVTTVIKAYNKNKQD